MDGTDARPNRRAAMGAMLTGGLLAAGAAHAQGTPPGTPAGTPTGYTSLMPDVPIAVPRTEFVYESIFDLLPSMNLGQGPWGERRMVPITGGTFAGPRMRGTVMPGGADRQLVRHDGARVLNALYELKTDDGAVITVNNKVLIKDQPGGGRYAFSTLDITAPEGPYGWLNDAVYVGTLHSLQPRPQVLIRVFRVIA